MNKIKQFITCCVLLFVLVPSAAMGGITDQTDSWLQKIISDLFGTIKPLSITQLVPIGDYLCYYGVTVKVTGMSESGFIVGNRVDTGETTYVHPNPSGYKLGSCAPLPPAKIHSFKIDLISDTANTLRFALIPTWTGGLDIPHAKVTLDGNIQGYVPRVKTDNNIAVDLPKDGQSHEMCIDTLCSSYTTPQPTIQSTSQPTPVKTIGTPIVTQLVPIGDYLCYYGVTVKVTGMTESGFIKGIRVDSGEQWLVHPDPSGYTLGLCAPQPTSQPQPSAQILSLKLGFVSETTQTQRIVLMPIWSEGLETPAAKVTQDDDLRGYVPRMKTDINVVLDVPKDGQTHKICIDTICESFISKSIAMPVSQTPSATPIIIESWQTKEAPGFSGIMAITGLILFCIIKRRYN